MLNNFKDFQLAIFALILALSIIICSNIISHTLSRSGVTVTGSASEQVISDKASWKLLITVNAPTKAKAYEEIKTQKESVTQYLIEKGIKPEEIEEQNLESYPVYETDIKTGNSTNKVLYYVINQTIKISSNEVNKIKELSILTQELLVKGIDITSYSPEYYYSQLSDIKIKLLEMASKDAKNRAQAMLKATGNRVGKIKSVKMGVFQITPDTSNEVSDTGINDTSTINKKINAVANITFSVR